MPFAFVFVAGTAVGGAAVKAWEWFGQLTDGYITMLKEDAEESGANDLPSPATDPAPSIAPNVGDSGPMPGPRRAPRT